MVVPPDQQKVTEIRGGDSANNSTNGTLLWSRFNLTILN